jgi:hypothetical protein
VQCARSWRGRNRQRRRTIRLLHAGHRGLLTARPPSSAG